MTAQTRHLLDTVRHLPGSPRHLRFERLSSAGGHAPTRHGFPSHRPGTRAAIRPRGERGRDRESPAGRLESASTPDRASSVRSREPRGGRGIRKGKGARTCFSPRTESDPRKKKKTYGNLKSVFQNYTLTSDLPWSVNRCYIRRFCE